jgi:hypothetical protein
VIILAWGAGDPSPVQGPRPCSTIRSPAPDVEAPDGGPEGRVHDKRAADLRGSAGPHEVDQSAPTSASAATNARPPLVKDHERVISGTPPVTGGSVSNIDYPAATGGVQMMFAALQLKMAQSNKERAMEHMDQMTANQAKAKECAKSPRPASSRTRPATPPP